MSDEVCRECRCTDGEHEWGCAFRANNELAWLLAGHQWEFDNRHYCTCGEVIRYDSPNTADLALARHQIEAAERAAVSRNPRQQGTSHAVFSVPSGAKGIRTP